MKDIIWILLYSNMFCDYFDVSYDATSLLLYKK